MNDYTEYAIQCDYELRDILIAELANMDFEGFVETEDGFTASISMPLEDEKSIENLLSKYHIAKHQWTKQIIKQQNWNAIWEADYQPIRIADKIYIRAPFHEMDEKVTYPITIQPKNTFGTGHHHTTRLVMELMLNENFQNKHVLDFGCGTGILGLMALKMGAQKIIGVDIDEWCVDNVSENKQLNELDAFEFRQGDLSQLQTDEQFEYVLANINKNILLHHFEAIRHHMHPKARLIISGFYLTDLPDLEKGANKSGLIMQNHIHQDEWCAAVFELA